MASTTNFKDFFQQWTTVQAQQLHELISASKSQNQTDHSLQTLLNRVITHYEEYYNVKSRSAKDNVFSMLSPPWTSSFEDGFLWIGGWRPTSAFQLLYSKSGLQLVAHLREVIQGVHTGDLGDLNPSQLVRADQLQRQTIREEREITEKMAKQQEKVADSETVELSGLMTEMMETDNGETGSGLDDRVDSVIKRKEEGIGRVLEMADGLRLRTLKGVIEMLSLKQAVHFLIAAAALHLRIHDWGKQADEKKLMGN